jgi:hypothetical protein
VSSHDDKTSKYQIDNFKHALNRIPKKFVVQIALCIIMDKVSQRPPDSEDRRKWRDKVYIRFIEHQAYSNIMNQYLVCVCVCVCVSVPVPVPSSNFRNKDIYIFF